MEDKEIKFTCNQIASDNVEFSFDEGINLLWIDVCEENKISRVAINKSKVEELRDWLTKQLESKP